MTLYDQSNVPIVLSHRTKILDARVLLVDDYPANILITGTLLEYFGLIYDAAINGLEAVQMVRQKKYTVILMDINMPEMDGITATEIIRKLEKEDFRLRQPIIALTAHPDFLEDDKARLLNMDGAIMKPFQPIQLETMLQKYIQLETI